MSIQEIVANAIADVIADRVSESVARQLTSERIDALVSPHVEATLSALGAPSVESTTPSTETKAKTKRQRAKAGVANMVTPTFVDVDTFGLDPVRAQDVRKQALSALSEWYREVPLPKGWTRKSNLPGLFTGLANKLASGNLGPHVQSFIARNGANAEAMSVFTEAVNIVVDIFASSGNTELANCANAIGDAYDDAMSALV